MEETPTFDEYRTGYISERWSVSDNCARALQLFELGYTISAVSRALPVTEGTVRSYHKRLQEKIHPDVLLTLTSSSKKFDVWGERDPSNYSEYGYDDGVRHAKAARENYPATDSKEQIDVKFRDRERPLNKGPHITEIDTELITLGDV